MQDGNFLLSALQPEAGVCSLALPSDLQLDRRGAEGPEAERLRAARVQEQVRARLLQLGQQPRHNGAAEPEPEAETARGTSRGQYHTLQSGFSSRSQGLSGDKTSGFRPIAKPAYSPASWSSRSAVDLSCSRRLSSTHNGGSAFGAAGYGGAQPTPPMPARPVSFHERSGVGSRADYDTLSLRSLRLGSGGLDDRYSVVSEQLEPAATSTYRGFAYERQASSSASRAGGLDWPEATEVSPSRTIRAPAMRTLQRFQSSHRSRGVGGAAPGAILEPVARAPSVRSLSLADSGHLPDVRGFNSYCGHRTLQRLSSGFDDIDLPSAVKYLMASDPNLQVLGAAYIQHKCYSDVVMSQLTAVHPSRPGDIRLPPPAGSARTMPLLDPQAPIDRIPDDPGPSAGDAFLDPWPLCPVALSPWSHLPHQACSPHPTFCPLLLGPSSITPNATPGSPQQGLWVRHRTPGQPLGRGRTSSLHAQKSRGSWRADAESSLPRGPGILWNLSSSDHLKDRLARDTLEQLTDLVLSPLSGAGGPPLIQQNASEAEIFYNATGFLRNLSSASQATRQKMRECHGLVDALVTYINHALDVGKCEDKVRGALSCLAADALTFAEVSKDPKGLEWLWSPQIVGLYNRLLQRCELNRHTTEAAAGGAGAITAGDHPATKVVSHLIRGCGQRGPDSEKSSRATSSLLANLWQYSKLHRDFRAKGYRKEDFLGP
ncbi:plakophilin-3 [Papio anubis]|uniref:plakophilin-3 n=1 Tax=Papio anubis TaxID=9555 RepID=UPI0012AD2F45|nr:plakophilin-3 [Papio anubis]